jgi:hypothetical protein
LAKAFRKKQSEAIVEVETKLSVFFIGCDVGSLTEEEEKLIKVLMLKKTRDFKE